MHLCWNLSDSIDWFCTLVDFQLPNHCKFFMWEDKYEAYLVDNGLFPFDIGIPDDAAASMEALLDELKVAVKEVQETMEEMKGSIVAIPPVLTAMRNTMNGMYGEMKGLRFGMAGNVVNKNHRLRERMMMLGWSIVFLLVAILVVSLKK